MVCFLLEEIEEGEMRGIVAEGRTARPGVALPPVRNQNHSPPTREAGGVGGGGGGGGDVRARVVAVHGRVGELRTECSNIRRMALQNVDTSRELVREGMSQIRALLRNVGLAGVRNSEAHERAALDRLSADYRDELAGVEGTLSDFERSVEELRRLVVNGERRLKLAEVEDFTHTLTNIGRSAACLKGSPSFSPSCSHNLS